MLPATDQTETEFQLDGERALEAIAGLWGLDAERPDEWRLERFGPSLGRALEELAGVAFAPTRELLRGPAREVRVFALEDDRRAPLIVCLAGTEGPMLCAGLEDGAELIPAGATPSPRLLLEVLERLLAVAGAIARSAGSRPARAPAGVGGPAITVADGVAAGPAR